MATYLKKAIEKSEASDSKTKDIVKRILNDIRSRGESAACALAAKFDNRTIGAVASRISRYEGMEGHARAADIRLRRFFPDEAFDFEVYDQKSYV